MVEYNPQAMTLILTLIDKNRIVQVSDRRLINTLSGEVHDDNANKAVCVGMSYIHFAASYTGVAYIGRAITENRTDYWLLDQLGSIARDGQPSVENICRSLSERAVNALSRLRGFKGLEVVLAGYERKNVAFRAAVSNMKVNKKGDLEVRDRFTSDVRRFHPWSPTPEIYLAGAVAAFEATDPTAKALKVSRDKVVRYLKVNREKLTEERVAQTMVWLTRAACTHKDYGHNIGRDCLSVVAFPRTPRRRAFLVQEFGVPRNANKSALFTAFYHPIAASSKHYAPHLADWYMDTMNVEADTDPEGAEHRPPPNRPVGTNLALRTRTRIHNLPGGPR
jgi:hypothetical protein